MLRCSGSARAENTAPLPARRLQPPRWCRAPTGRSIESENGAARPQPPSPPALTKTASLPWTMRSTWHSSSSSSATLPSPLKYTPKSLLTFTHTLTPTWTGKYISTNTFIFSVSLRPPRRLRGADVTLRNRLQNAGKCGFFFLVVVVGGNNGQLHTRCSFKANLPHLVLMCFYRSSHHLNLHILVVHLLEKDGEMLFFVE